VVRQSSVIGALVCTVYRFDEAALIPMFHRLPISRPRPFGECRDTFPRPTQGRTCSPMLSVHRSRLVSRQPCRTRLPVMNMIRNYYKLWSHWPFFFMWCAGSAARLGSYAGMTPHQLLELPVSITDNAGSVRCCSGPNHVIASTIYRTETDTL
jgi:hypothetical protein